MIVRFWKVEVAPAGNSNLALAAVTVKVAVVEAESVKVVVALPVLLVISKLLNALEPTIAPAKVVVAVVLVEITVPELCVNVPEFR